MCNYSKYMYMYMYVFCDNWLLFEALPLYTQNLDVAVAV